ncbi:MAG: Mechanosensitive channel MscK [Anaerolineales bacterium]|nr:Mechanosensitive channel MscK [Anaerolineales bacterium]
MNEWLPKAGPWLQLLSRLSLDIAFEGLWLLLGGYLTIRGLQWAAQTYLHRYERHTLIVQRVMRLIELCVWVGIVPVGLLRLLQPDRDMMLAILGAGAVAFGFALKDLAAGLVAGVVITLDRPFQVGDYVEIEGYAGEVANISLRSTTIISLNDDAITVPNSTFLTASVSNANAGSLACMVVTDFYLAHDAGYEQVKTILWEAAATSKFVAIDRPIVVVSRERPYGTQFSVKAYVADYRNMSRFASDIAESAKREFRTHDIAYANAAYASYLYDTDVDR